MIVSLPRSIARKFQNLILTWYATHQRDLPWRTTHDPYAILVSEIMLQQTQVDRVLTYWTGWIERWPTFEALVHTSTSDVIRAWKGLGYNRRAVNLKRAASVVLERGGFTSFVSQEMIQTLPGVGPSTAAALMNFVWNIDTPYLETNIRRIMQRLAYGPETTVGWRNNRELLDVARRVLPAGQAKVWPHALMDFGALVCRPSDPTCSNCLLQPLTPQYSTSGIQHRVLKQGSRGNPLIRFEETNRYWRGRMIDVLRDHEQLSRHDLYQTLPQTVSQLTIERYEQLITDLAREGLVSIQHKIISLPK